MDLNIIGGKLWIITTTLDNVTLYSAKLRNPTQVATMTTTLDLGVNRRSEEKVLQRTGYYRL